MQQVLAGSAFAEKDGRNGAAPKECMPALEVIGEDQLVLPGADWACSEQHRKGEKPGDQTLGRPTAPVLAGLEGRSISVDRGVHQ
jgi:hypothetical protein